MERIRILGMLIPIMILISGCIGKDIDENDNGNIEIIEQNTLFLENTEYGLTNISYAIEEHGSGRSREKYINISIKVEDKEDKLNSMNLRYWTEGGGGSGLYHNEQTGVYYLLIIHNYRFMDFWVLFYEKGERKWDDFNSTYYNPSVLKKALSFSISEEIDIGIDGSIIEIKDILYGFDENDPETFNATFNVTSSSDIRDLKINYVMIKNIGGGYSSSSSQKDEMVGERYVKSIEITSEDKENKDYLLFCLSVSNTERKRITTEVFWFPLNNDDN
ncbi:MAG: hypothetical protein ACMUHU_05925 [Thermoplasmatota archaeon]